MQLRISRAARADLIRLHDWLADIDVAVAGDAQLAIARKLALLKNYPALGSPLPDGRRKLSVPRYGYLIFYRRTGSVIVISRIVHAREDWR